MNSGLFLGCCRHCRKSWGMVTKLFGLSERRRGPNAATGTSADKRRFRRSALSAMASSHWAPNALALMAALYATTSGRTSWRNGAGRHPSIPIFVARPSIQHPAMVAYMTNTTESASAYATNELVVYGAGSAILTCYQGATSSMRAKSPSAICHS